jgi:hypothetical protein
MGIMINQDNAVASEAKVNAEAVVSDVEVNSESEVNQQQILTEDSPTPKA